MRGTRPVALAVVAAAVVLPAVRSCPLRLLPSVLPGPAFWHKTMVLEARQASPLDRCAQHLFDSAYHRFVLRISKGKRFTSLFDAPVRPMRCVYASTVSGMSKLITCEISETSMPRAAMSVATRMSYLPRRKPLIACLALVLRHIALQCRNAIFSSL